MIQPALNRYTSLTNTSALLFLGLASLPGSSAAADDTTLSEVVVTARKQSESIVDVPQSISALGGADLAKMDVHSFQDYANKIPDLSFSYGTGSQGIADSRTIAIRGISGVGTTAVYIDDIAVDQSMDPRVLDVERIEVLRGPQGTLFGEGSLGGAVRMVSVKPNLSENGLSYNGATAITSHGGSANYDGGFTGNVVLDEDVLAVRASGFFAHDAGFITRYYPGSDGKSVGVNDQGADYSYGGSLSARLKFTDQLEAVLRVMTQWQQDHGFPETYAPLPSFAPNDLTIDRAVNLQETANDGWVMPTLDLTYDAEHWSFTSASSFVSRNIAETEDSTEGTAQITELYFAYTSPLYAELWRQQIHNRRVSEELRASYKKNSFITGTFGLYYSQFRNRIYQPPYYIPGIAAAGLYPTDLGWDLDVTNLSQDRALFGEAYITPLPRTTVTLGARYYKLTEHLSFFDDGIIAGGPTQSSVTNSQTGVSPKAAIEYKITPEVGVYTSASKGFRPGNGTTPLPSYCYPALAGLGLTPESAQRYGSDWVWDYEVGGKAQIDRVLLSTSVYQLNWSHIQQTTFLASCGYTLTTNAGAARSRGAEFELSGALAEDLSAHAGVGYDHAVITEQGTSPQAPGSPVHEIPEWTASVGLNYTHPLTDTLTASIGSDFSYVGTSYSAVTNFFAPQQRPSYEIWNMQLGVRRGRDELSLFGRNLTNKKANLGDMNPIAYNKTIDGVVDPRVVVLRPLTVGLRYTHDFE